MGWRCEACDFDAETVREMKIHEKGYRHLKQVGEFPFPSSSQKKTNKKSFSK